jgi:ABC-type sugar transport system ATPase subunit
MANSDVDLDELMGNEFLDSLDDESAEIDVPERQTWVVDDENHTTYKSWQAILALKVKKENLITNYGKVANKKTPKSLYEISKSEVSERVKISAQGIFRSSTFSPSILGFFDGTNDDLRKFHENEQLKQKKRQINMGIRSKKKEVIAKSHQCIEKELNQLKAKTTKEVLDLAINKIPLDYKLKLGL